MDKDTKSALGIAVVICVLLGGVLLGLSREVGPQVSEGEALRAEPEGVHQASPTDFTVESDFLDKNAENLNQALQTARLIPDLDAQGRFRGFFLATLEPGSLWEKFGLREGDRLVGLNDTVFDGPEKGLLAVQEIRKNDTVYLKLVRAGAPLTIRYQIVQSKK